MTIELSHKEVKEIGRLRRLFMTRVIDFNAVETLLEGLEQKVILSTAPPVPRKRISRKPELKDQYRLKIFTTTKRTA